MSPATTRTRRQVQTGSDTTTMIPATGSTMSNGSSHIGASSKVLSLLSDVGPR